MLESFGAGTAVIVSSVKNIEFKGTNYKIPIDEKLNAGPITFKIRKDILDIQEGKAVDKYGWVKRVIWGMKDMIDLFHKKTNLY